MSAITRRTRPVRIGVSLICGLAAVCFAGTDGNATDAVTLRASPGVSEEAVRYLASVAEPTVLDVGSAEDLNSILNRRCGTVSPAYLNVFREFNKGKSPEQIKETTTVRIPACFHYVKSAKVKVFPKDSVSQIAARHTGWAGPVTVGAIIDRNFGITFSALSDQNPVLQIDQELSLPYKADRVSYNLKPGVEAETVVANLTSFAEHNLTEVQNSSGLARHIVPASIRPNGTPSNCARGAEGNSRWPFDPAALAATLRHNNRVTANNTLVDIQTAIVAVADSGLDGFDGSVFPAKLFAIQPAEARGQPGVDDDGHGHVDDIFGTNIPRKRGPPSAFRRYFAGDHGTHVAGLVLGGPRFEPFRDLLEDRIKLKVMNLIDRTREPPHNTLRFRSSPSSISEAIEYAKKHGANIVNVSFSAKTRLWNFEGFLSGNPPILVVASAGNQEGRIERLDEYPAAYGGDRLISGSQVLTVAAHDAEYKLIPESNWSKSRVDIAAPGCGIDSYSFDGTREKYDGTSQAAPLTTFAAALLYAEGIGSPLQIKNRLIASADVRPKLIGKVIADGSLNVVKALEVYRDVITTNSSNAVKGKVTSPSNFDVCDGWGQLGVEEIVKVVPNYKSESQDGTLYFLKNRQGSLTKVICKKIAETEFSIMVDGENSPKKFSSSEIFDVVFANFR